MMPAAAQEMAMLATLLVPDSRAPRMLFTLGRVSFFRKAMARVSRVA